MTHWFILFDVEYCYAVSPLPACSGSASSVGDAFWRASPLVWRASVRLPTSARPGSGGTSPGPSVGMLARSFAVWTRSPMSRPTLHRRLLRGDLWLCVIQSLNLCSGLGVF